MKTNSDIINEKQAILNFISKSDDSKLITKLKEVIDSFQHVKEEDFEIPEWHKKIVQNRLKNTRSEDYISREELNNRINL